MHSKANDEVDCTVGSINWKKDCLVHQMLWRRQFSDSLLSVPPEGVMRHSKLRQKRSVFLRNVGSELFLFKAFGWLPSPS